MFGESSAACRHMPRRATGVVVKLLSKQAACGSAPLRIFVIPEDVVGAFVSLGRAEDNDMDVVAWACRGRRRWVPEEPSAEPLPEIGPGVWFAHLAGSHGRTTNTVFPGRRGAGGGP